jgi:hypothetical protein
MNMGMKRCGGDALADNIVLSSSLKLVQTHRHACTCIVVFFALSVIVVGGAYILLQQMRRKLVPWVLQAPLKLFDTTSGSQGAKLPSGRPVFCGSYRRKTTIGWMSSASINNDKA